VTIEYKTRSTVPINFMGSKKSVSRNKLIGKRYSNQSEALAAGARSIPRKYVAPNLDFVDDPIIFNQSLKLQPHLTLVKKQMHNRNQKPVLVVSDMD
jgi:hypothetical protein